MGAEGAACSRCGTWVAAGALRCACGARPGRYGREVAQSWGAALLALAAVLALRADVLAYAGALALVPLLLVPAASLFGALSGLRAARRGRGRFRVAGALGFTCCAAFIAIPAARIAERLLGGH